jgi:cytochrome c-type biogenesis protein
MSEHLSILIAFGAGLLSFLSPCVLPLIPSYLCVLGGASVNTGTLQDGKLKPRLVAGTVSFILGFSAVFIVLSIVFAATFSLMGGASRYINWISGAVVIVLGLNIILEFLPFLNQEKRFHLKTLPRSAAGNFLAGAAFGAGWTPCVGPVLGSILLLASQSGGIPRAALYLAAYSTGLGVPFFLASLFFNAFMKTSAKLRARLPLIRRVSGALLVVIGVLIVTGRYQALNTLTAAAGQQAGRSAPAPAAAPEGVTRTAPLSRSPAFPAAAGRDIAAGTAAGDASPGTARGGNVPDNAVPASVTAAFTAAGLPVAARGIAPRDFELSFLDGSKRRLSGFHGQVVFLNFWATWCEPCRVEMPSMEAMYRRLKDRGVTVLAVDLGESPSQIISFMNENGFTFPAVLDARGEIGGYFGVQAIPATYIIDRRGLVISRVTGSLNWNQSEIIAALESL